MINVDDDSLYLNIGAVFTAVNTMYTAVASRTREIATLRALGFNAVPVVISVLAEAAILSAVGGLLGGAIAWAASRSDRSSPIIGVCPGWALNCRSASISMPCSGLRRCEGAPGGSVQTNHASSRAPSCASSSPASNSSSASRFSRRTARC